MLTDEELMEIRNRAKLNSNRQIDPMAFAREIERAVLAKAGEQSQAPYVFFKKVKGKDEWSSWNEFSDGSAGGKPLFDHPLPAQAIPDKEYFIDPRFDDGEYYLLGSDINKLLSAPPKVKS